MNGWTDGWTDGRMDGRVEEVKSIFFRDCFARPRRVFKTISGKNLKKNENLIFFVYFAHIFSSDFFQFFEKKIMVFGIISITAQYFFLVVSHLLIRVFKTLFVKNPIFFIFHFAPFFFTHLFFHPHLFFMLTFFTAPFFTPHFFSTPLFFTPTFITVEYLFGPHPPFQTLAKNHRYYRALFGSGMGISKKYELHNGVFENPTLIDQTQINWKDYQKLAQILPKCWEKEFLNCVSLVWFFSDNIGTFWKILLFLYFTWDERDFVIFCYNSSIFD